MGERLEGWMGWMGRRVDEMHRRGDQMLMLIFAPFAALWEGLLSDGHWLASQFQWSIAWRTLGVWHSEFKSSTIRLTSSKTFLAKKIL